MSDDLDRLTPEELFHLKQQLDKMPILTPWRPEGPTSSSMGRYDTEGRQRDGL
jgi:hypothetical protein